MDKSQFIILYELNRKKNSSNSKIRVTWLCFRSIDAKLEQLDYTYSMTDNILSAAVKKCLDD